MEKKIFIQEILPLRPRLLAYAESLMDNRDDAEDIAQEVLLKLWSMKEELSVYNSVLALSLKITKNLCLNALKYRADRHVDMETLKEKTDESTLSPYSILEQKDNLQQVNQIIERLSGLQQAVLKMKHVEGLEIDEIALITGSTLEAVRMNLSRARKRVKTLFYKITK
ncbi:MAG: RNA polymerase sigma factor [Tannerellaceae bacterium]|jgi:RNA polymerase sigma-70 factor (ECF subfamily)|nr:RNA polymerase sigma factor [Tannerellaceae bacterium]